MVNEAAITLCTDKLIVPFEGFSASPYQDVGGVWTQGYGTTVRPDGRPITAASPPITEAQALAWVRAYLVRAEHGIDRLVTVTLNTNQEAAILDFIYNLGIGNFEESTLLKLLNQGNYQGAADQFPLWDHAANGEVLLGLQRRREAEKELFLS